MEKSPKENGTADTDQKTAPPNACPANGELPLCKPRTNYNAISTGIVQCVAGCVLIGLGASKFAGNIPVHGYLGIAGFIVSLIAGICGILSGRSGATLTTVLTVVFSLCGVGIHVAALALNSEFVEGWMRCTGSHTPTSSPGDNADFIGALFIVSIVVSTTELLAALTQVLIAFSMIYRACRRPKTPTLQVNQVEPGDHLA